MNGGQNTSSQMQVHLGIISNPTQCRYRGENNATNEQMGSMTLETKEMTEIILPTFYS
jgi:hypothetical protein